MSPKRLAVPAYYEIASDLREEIEAGRLRPGDMIPSEAQLCESYGVSRMTVRQGLNMLSEAGYIQSVPGKGSYVASPDFDRLLLEVRPCALPDGNGLEIVDYEVQVSLAGEVLAQRLGIRSGNRVRELHRVMTHQDRPVAYERTYLPWAGTRVPRREEMRASFAELVARAGERPFVKIRARLAAGIPDPHEAQVLELPDPPYAMLLEQTVLSSEGEILGWGRTCYHPERYEFQAEFSPFNKRF
ncbi:MAG: GntR family transcriptional regulator [Thermoleophilia bacterium]